MNEVMMASKRKRAGAFLIDYLIFVFLESMICMPVAFWLLNSNFADNVVGQLFNNINDKALQVFILVNLISAPFFILFLFKDSIKGASLGKRVFKISIRDKEKPDLIPNIFKLALRNVLAFIWPVEVILLFLMKRDQRLGDLLANTIVVEDNVKN